MCVCACVCFYHPQGCPVVHTALNRTGLYLDVTNDCSVGAQRLADAASGTHVYFFCSPVRSVGPQAILITTGFGRQKTQFLHLIFSLILFNFNRCRMILTPSRMMSQIHFRERRIT